MTNKPSNIEQRISERHDATGADPELARLITGDAEAARLDETYARLARALTGWRTLPEGVDFRSFRATVANAVAADVEYRALQAHDAGESSDAAGLSADAASRLSREYKKTDDAIRAAAAGPMPAVDWNALKSRISAAVRTEAAESDPHHERTILLPAAKAAGAARRAGRAADASKHFLWKKLALPLSAAAAIAITATAWFNRGAPVKPVPAPISMNRIMVQLDAPQQAGMVNIAFDESPMPAALAEELPTRGAAIAVGPGHDETTLLPDDALWQ